MNSRGTSYEDPDYPDDFMTHLHVPARKQAYKHTNYYKYEFVDKFPGVYFTTIHQLTSYKPGSFIGETRSRNPRGLSWSEAHNYTRFYINDIPDTESDLELGGKIAFIEFLNYSNIFSCVIDKITDGIPSRTTTFHVSCAVIVKIIPFYEDPRIMVSFVRLNWKDIKSDKCPKTFDICRVAIKRSKGAALEYVPTDIDRRDELVELALSLNLKNVRYAQLSDFIDANVYEKILNINPALIMFMARRNIPDEHVDSVKKMARFALSRWSRAIEYIPENIADDEMYKTAVADTGFNLQFVPSTCRKELEELAISTYPPAIEWVSKK